MARSFDSWAARHRLKTCAAVADKSRDKRFNASALRLAISFVGGSFFTLSDFHHFMGISTSRDVDLQETGRVSERNSPDFMNFVV